jgi:putative FmdB family regulatory protein
VPTYEYECDKCREVFEVRQRISEPALTVHAECGGAVRRLLSPAPFILKGDGWYVTDYPSEARKKAVAAEKGTTSTDKSGDTKSDATTKSEAKPETKSSDTKSSETKAASSTTSAGPSAPA